jgi:hypothetical protein
VVRISPQFGCVFQNFSNFLVKFFIETIVCIRLGKAVLKSPHSIRFATCNDGSEMWQGFSRQVFKEYGDAVERIPTFARWRFLQIFALFRVGNFKNMGLRGSTALP